MKKNLNIKNKFLLMLCFLGIFSLIQAEEVNIKIDFARVVQDAGVDKPNKTAACIIVWVKNKDEKVFCRYELEKANIFFRDDTQVNKIFTYADELPRATVFSFPDKINKWLSLIEKDFSVNIQNKSKIAPLFVEFAKQGAQEYSQYDVALFKHTQPYDLRLPRQTIDVNKLLYNFFAILVHNEVHRAVSIYTPKPKLKPKRISAAIPASDANSKIITIILSKTMMQILAIILGILLFLFFIIGILNLFTKKQNNISKLNKITKKSKPKLTKTRQDRMHKSLESQYEACANAIKEVDALNNPKCYKLAKLLNIENIMLNLRYFVTEKPDFESDEKLLERMFAINGGTWLSEVLRADDLFKTYFSDIQEMKPLANSLAVIAMMLETALEELGVEVIKPELLKKPSENLPESAYKFTDNKLFIELTHDKVMSKLSEKKPRLVVDIEKYGFVSQDNPKPSMTILYADLAEWEFY